MRHSHKPRHRSFFAAMESLECREVLSGAPVQMFPGSDFQTTLPYSESTLTFIESTANSIARDVNGQIIDFNHDGLPDLLNISVQNILNGGLRPLTGGYQTNPLLANGAGLFELTRVNGTRYSYGDAAAVLDWNSDGNQDYLAAAQMDRGDTRGFGYWIYQNDGKGVFTIATSGWVSTTLTSQAPKIEGQILVVRDFNGDGAPDMLLPNIEFWTIYPGVVVGGQWNGTFSDTNTQILQSGIGGTAAVNAQASDLNGDGKLDIITPSPTGLRIFMNDGAGQFPTNGTFDLTSIKGKSNRSMVVADFNNDGKPDLAGSDSSVVIKGVGQVSIFLNTSPTPITGNPTFATPYGAGVPLGVYSQLVVGDMNLDGSMDIVTVNSNNDNETYTILTNDGTGQFVGQHVFNAFNKNQNYPNGLGIADWNHDGLPDVSVGICFSSFDNPRSNYNVAGGIGLSFNNTFQPLGLNTATFPAAVPGVPYSYQIKFKGGNASLPYHVSLSPYGNALPAGLTLSSTGLISGTPTQSGAFQPMFNITQPNGQYGSALSYLNVGASAVSAVLPGIMPNAVAGLPFQQQLTTTLGPANWVVAAGALPAGLTLSQSGLISGTPLALGTYNFTVLGSGSGFQGVMNYQMLVQATAAPVVTSLLRFGYHAQPTTLAASFSQPLDAASASNVGNYVLTSAGADGRFGTRDDRNIALAAAAYNPNSNTVTLSLVQKNIPLRQLYRLAINGTPAAGLQNTGGVFLGGQGVGSPGTNYVQIFSGKILTGPNLMLKAGKSKAGIKG